MRMAFRFTRVLRNWRLGVAIRRVSLLFMASLNQTSELFDLTSVSTVSFKAKSAPAAKLYRFQLDRIDAKTIGPKSIGLFSRYVGTGTNSGIFIRTSVP